MKDKELINSNSFFTSISLKEHPMQKLKSNLKVKYFSVLSSVVDRYSCNKEYSNAWLIKYDSLLMEKKSETDLYHGNNNKDIKLLLNNRLKLCHRKCRYWLLCDIALILQDKDAITEAYAFLCSYLSKKQCVLMKILLDALFYDEEIPKSLNFVKVLITQYRVNRRFLLLPERRIIVTANMSAGKSMLINAIVGKSITKTAQEACTSGLTYIYNKPFEDDTIHVRASPLKMNSDYSELAKLEQIDTNYISSFFNTWVKPQNRICIIDTPGVNSVLHKDHKNITKDSIKEANYDVLIYVLNATKLGTEEEIRYLKYIYKNALKEKVVFVMNKLDEFKVDEDSILDSIKRVKSDLCEIGFEHPIICPLSAYVAMLTKRKWNGDELTRREEKTYAFYVNMFSQNEYDFSLYYDDEKLGIKSNDECAIMSIKCGLYSFEKILFGGSL